MNRRGFMKMLALTPLVGLLKPEPVKARPADKLRDHNLCGVGGVYNCSKCQYLEECRASSNNIEADSHLYNKQLFILANPSISNGVPLNTTNRIKTK